jgi:membrane-bound metal-dependent hydrolase YbcI (DUF457 family)
MPSPVGHAIAGFAAAWIADGLAAPTGPRPVAPVSRGALAALGGGFAAACALLAASPDLDILTGTHRAFSHSLGAAVVVGVAAGFLARRLRLRTVVAGATCAAAYATHVLLDWLARDAVSPHGIMALWPGSPAYYTSGVDVFFEVSRRYWDPSEFIVGNLGSLAWELVVLAPVAGVAWWLRARAKGSR